MSLIKKKTLPLSSSSSALTSSKTNVTRKKVLSKPGWDVSAAKLEKKNMSFKILIYLRQSTNSNLEQYKPSTEELVNIRIIFTIIHYNLHLMVLKQERRRQSCQSKNIEAVKNDKQKQSILKSAMNKKPQLDSKTQLAIMREILLEDEQVKH